MSREEQVKTRGILALSVLAVTAVALALLAWSHGSAGSADAQQLPGMTLSGPATAGVGETFQITVDAFPAPQFDVSGFQTEVLFGGLVWMPRAECTDSVQVTHSSGQPVPVCANAEGPIGQARHAVSSGAVPPLPAIDAISDGDPIIELDVQCPDVGSYTVQLTGVSQAAGESAFGATYFDTFFVPYFVEGTDTTTIDLDGNTVPSVIPVVDSLDVTCEEAVATPTPTTEPVATTAASPPEELSPITVADTGTGGAQGDSAGLWAAISAILVASAAGFGILGWRYARSRP